MEGGQASRICNQKQNNTGSAAVVGAAVGKTKNRLLRIHNPPTQLLAGGQGIEDFAQAQRKTCTFSSSSNSSTSYSICATLAVSSSPATSPGPDEGVVFTAAVLVPDLEEVLNKIGGVLAGLHDAIVGSSHERCRSYLNPKRADLVGQMLRGSKSFTGA